MPKTTPNSPNSSRTAQEQLYTAQLLTWHIWYRRTLLYSFGGHVGVCWLHACLAPPLEGHTTSPKQLRNIPRTATVLEQSDTAKMGYIIQWTFSEHSVNIQWTFSEHSVNIQWTFTEHSVNIQGAFREHSVNIQWTFSEHSVNIQWTFSEHPVNIHGTFSEHSGNIQGTFREHSGNIQSQQHSTQPGAGGLKGNIQGTFSEHSGNV
jgi:hypothetical protein